MSTRLTVCPACGQEARLTAATAEDTVSRCYVCGDGSRTLRGVPQAWSAAAAVEERAPATAAEVGQEARGRPEIEAGAGSRGEVPRRAQEVRRPASILPLPRRGRGMRARLRRADAVGRHYPIEEQPRDHRGRFMRGWVLWTRWDGERSWIEWPEEGG